MLKSLALKELRETIGILLLVLATCLVAFGGIVNSAFQVFGANESVLFSGYYISQGYVPFARDPSSLERFYWVCAAAAIALGLRQTLGESIHGTYPFLFHRPIGRRQVIGVKLAIGLAVYLVCGSMMILAYGLWAATPGTHASPFAWSMTATAWAAMIEMSLIYFAAFLSGIRPGRWFGTRLLPLVAVVPLIVNVFPEPFRTGSFLHLFTILVADAWTIAAILFVAQTRDYS
jgi:hypothetical protein